MSWVEPVSTAVTAASIINQVAQSSNLIRKHASRILFRIKNGSASIPIFGAGGVGKSTTAKIVGGGEPLDIVTPYEESWLVEPVKLTGDVPGTLLAAPGQDQRVDRHWPELLASVTEGKSFGLLNVVAYGYHSFAIQSFKEHDVYRTGMTEADFMQAYLPSRRAVEIDRLKKLIEHLKVLNRPFWMLTLVTKQDLWWKDRKAVRDHYEKGEYGALVKTLLDGGKAGNFQHEFLPVSLSIGNMKSPTGETLAETTGGYDTAIHLAHMQNLFARLHAMIAQGAL